MEWPNATRIKGLDKVHILHICAFFIILSLLCTLPVYAQQDSLPAPIGSGNLDDGYEGVTVDMLTETQTLWEKIIAQNNDLEQTIGLSKANRGSEVDIGGYKIIINTKNLPLRMLDSETDREVTYDYLNLDSRGNESEPESDEDINKIEMTSKASSDIELILTLDGEDARKAVIQMQSFVLSRDSGADIISPGGTHVPPGEVIDETDPDPAIETKPKPDEAPALPDLLRYGLIVTEIADAFDEFGNLKEEEESEGPKAKVQNKKAASSADSMEARRELYNKIYYTKIKKILDREGLSSDYKITTDGRLRIFLTPSVKKK